MIEGFVYLGDRADIRQPCRDESHGQETELGGSSRRPCEDEEPRTIYHTPEEGSDSSDNVAAGGFTPGRG